MEFLLHYGLFLAKAATVVIAVVLTVVVVFALGRRGPRGERLEVTHLNRRYREMSRTLEQSLLPKKALKARLKAEKKSRKTEEKAAAAHDGRARLFVIDFHGDLRASGIGGLREEVTAILTLARKSDEVVVRVENAGGLVHGHGLAASQLARLRDREIPLTVTIDKVAASGGYMMACVADRVLAAPFALVGSIGVLAQVPNFNRLLDRHGIDFEQIKAGENKRSLTLFGKNTEEDRQKMQRDIEAVHALFKGFVARYRPGLDIESVATGEHWYGSEALAHGLVDELKTSDDYLLEASERADLYAVKYTDKQALGQRLSSLLAGGAGELYQRLAELRR